MALYVGDGVGAGLVLSGALYQGDMFSAGEVGHLNLRTHTLRVPLRPDRLPGGRPRGSAS